ncbi:AraC family transcriptional regulator [Spirosoma humi]
MKRYKQFQPLVVDEVEATEWAHPIHRHNHYELIYIRQGSGTHYIQENSLPYVKGDWFLVGPDDDHHFVLAETTQFLFIKFTDVYIHQVSSDMSWFLRHLEYLMKSRETHWSTFRLSAADQCSAAYVVEVIRWLRQDMLANERLIWLQVLTIASLLQRNMPALQPTRCYSRDLQAVFCYIHKYIYSPEKLKAAVMAAHFHTTADYIGPYFKRNTGTTLRAYVGKYRKMLIEQRLASGNYSLKQVAADFDLTDESHVRKVLR